MKLNNGLTCPLIGLGTTRMKNVTEVVYQSIKSGTRLIDTASFYKNEKEVGEGIKKAIEEGIVDRKELFIITKFWITEKDNPEKAIKDSLNRLGLAYVDLYLDHWPISKNYNSDAKEPIKICPIHEVWKKMEKLVEQGLTKYIGVSNYSVQSISNILSFCKIPPSFNEVEFHPYLFQKELKEFCDKENIKIIAYNPLVRGGYCKERHEKIMEEMKLDLLNEPDIINLSKKYNKTPGQIVLNWFIHLGIIPIPGTSNPERMKENLAAAYFKMEENDIKVISSFKKQFRFCDSYRIYGINLFS